MTTKKTIRAAITAVLQSSDVPLTTQQIYERIVDNNFYDFKAKDPVHVVKNTLRRHAVNLQFPTARKKRYFRLTNGDEYCLLEEPVSIEPNIYEVKGTGKDKKRRIVTVPPESRDDDESEDPENPTHSEMQYRLLELGARLGFSIWAPTQDRSKSWGEKRIGDIHGYVNKLPGQFSPVALRTVQYIDVIWIEKQAVIAAFEIEHTSSIYSGLLRMSDLLTVQPNLQIRWYIVAPDRRFEKFANEVARPTFSSFNIPLHQICKFLPYGILNQKLKDADQFVKHLRPGFLEDIAEGFDPEEAFAE